jgi:hypothetical protein
MFGSGGANTTANTIAFNFSKAVTELPEPVPLWLIVSLV